MKNLQSNSLAQAVADHPWSSLQDALLLSGGMIIAAVLALEFDLFRFGDQLTAEDRRLTLAELIFLTLLLAAGLVAFILRRLYEARGEAARRACRNLEMQRLRDQALRDPLTGLLNRRGLLSALASSTSDADSGVRPTALLLLWLDGIERVNDLHGRAVGDRALKVVAERLRAAARPEDIMARLDGSHELAVLAHDLDREAAQALGERLIASLQSDVLIEQDAQKIGVSIGAIMIDGLRMTPAEIVNAADLAMRRAKEEPRPTLLFYDAPGSTIRN